MNAVKAPPRHRALAAGDRVRDMDERYALAKIVRILPEGHSAVIVYDNGGAGEFVAPVSRLQLIISSTHYVPATAHPFWKDNRS